MAKRPKKGDDELTDGQFRELLRACHEISLMFQEGVVFIGGIAVYLHAINSSSARSFAEFTHDADFYISLADMSDLRDVEEVIPNRRLNKHQLIKRGFEFDIYTERHSALVVPYDQVITHSIVYDELRVASLEHLLVLKLEAYRDRASSTKGQKDAKDVIRILLVGQAGARKFNEELVTAYFNDEHLSLLEKIYKSAEFISLTRGNAKEAKELREKFKVMWDRIKG